MNLFMANLVITLIVGLLFGLLWDWPLAIRWVEVLQVRTWFDWMRFGRHERAKIARIERHMTADAGRRLGKMAVKVRHDDDDDDNLRRKSVASSASSTEATTSDETKKIPPPSPAPAAVTGYQNEGANIYEDVFSF